MGLFKRKAADPWPLDERMKAQSRVVDAYYRHWIEHQLDPSIGLFAHRQKTITEAIAKVENPLSHSMAAAMDVMATPSEAKEFIQMVESGRAYEIRALQLMEGHNDAWRRVLGETFQQLNCQFKQIIASDLEEYQLHGECLRGIKDLLDDEELWNALVALMSRKLGGDIVVKRLLS